MLYPAGPCLVDTSILIRLNDLASPIRLEVVEALRKLAMAGTILFIAPQCLVEFWAVATRPIERNGLGMTPAQTEGYLIAMKVQFTLLSETPALFDEWERLVTTAQVSGKPTHDTRLVAFMGIHRISNLLTLNPADFKRFIPLTGIVVVEPDLPSRANP